MNTTTVLFIRSGNIYRSRYAEAYLNHVARSQGLSIQAKPRGLTVHIVEIGTSPHVIERMKAMGISLSCMAPDKIALTEEDLREATIIIALKDEEHRPMLEQRFPSWADRIIYWDIGDVGEMTPQEALSKIEQHVSDLLDVVNDHVFELV